MLEGSIHAATASSAEVSPLLLLSSLIGAFSAALLLAGAARNLYLRTIGRRRDRYRRLARLGTGAHLPFFTAVLGEPPAVQHTVSKADCEVPTEPGDRGHDPEWGGTKQERRDFLAALYIDRDYYVQAICDQDRTVLAYSVTTRSRRFHPRLEPYRRLNSLRRWRLRRQTGVRPSEPPRIILGRTRFAELDLPEPEQVSPPHLRLRLGAHNFDYSEFSYFGYPGHYQSFVWTASDVARQGRVGPLLAARQELDRDEWPDPDGHSEPDWEAMPEVQRLRRETVITTYSVCGGGLALRNYPMPRFGPSEREVFTLD